MVTTVNTDYLKSYRDEMEELDSGFNSETESSIDSESDNDDD